MLIQRTYFIYKRVQGKIKRNVFILNTHILFPPIAMITVKQLRVLNCSILCFYSKIIIFHSALKRDEKIQKATAFPFSTIPTMHFNNYIFSGSKESCRTLSFLTRAISRCAIFIASISLKAFH